MIKEIMEIDNFIEIKRLKTWVDAKYEQLLIKEAIKEFQINGLKQ